MKFSIDYNAPSDVDELAIQINEAGFTPVSAPTADDLSDASALEEWCSGALKKIAALGLSDLLNEAKRFHRGKVSRREDILQVFESVDAVRHMIAALRVYTMSLSDPQFLALDELTTLHEKTYVIAGRHLANGEPWSVSCVADALAFGMGFIEEPTCRQENYYFNMKEIYNGIQYSQQTSRENPVGVFQANSEDLIAVLGWVGECLETMAVWHERGWFAQDKKSPWKHAFERPSDFRVFAEGLGKFPNFLPVSCISLLEVWVGMEFFYPGEEPFGNAVVSKALLENCL